MEAKVVSCPLSFFLKKEMLILGPYDIAEQISKGGKLRNGSGTGTGIKGGFTLIHRYRSMVAGQNLLGAGHVVYIRCSRRQDQNSEEALWEMMTLPGATTSVFTLILAEVVAIH